MMRLLKIEYLKVKNYRTFWWILGIYAVVVPLLYMSFGKVDVEFLPSKTALYHYPTIWKFLTWAASWWNVLLGVLIVILVCNDIGYKTQRQQIIEGMTRTQLILGKLYFLIALALFVTLYTFLLGAIIGSIYSTPANMFNDIFYLGIYFVQTLGYFAFAFFFAVLIQRPALSIILYIIIIAVDWFLYIPGVMGEYAEYFPTITISELTPNPFYDRWILMQKMAAQARGEVWTDPLNMGQTIRSILATAYISIFFLVGMISVKRRDL